MKASNLCEEESQDQEAFGGWRKESIALVVPPENLYSDPDSCVEWLKSPLISGSSNLL